MQHRHWLYLLAWVCTAASGIAATLFSVYLPSIAADLAANVPVKEFVPHLGSWAGGSFLMGWALGAFVLGAVADRVGRRIALFICVLLSTVGMALTAFISSVSVLIILRFLTGFGAGSVLVLTVVLVSEAFKGGRRPMLVGILINAFPVGFIIAGLIASTHIDWRSAYHFTSVLLVLPVLTLLAVRESDMWSATASDGAAASVFAISAPIYRRDLLISLTLFGSMLVGIWAVFAWMPTWVHQLSTPQSAQSHRGTINMLLGAGCVAGGAVSGLLSERIGRRPATALGYLGCLVMTVVIFHTDQQPGSVLFASTFLMSTFIGMNQGVLSVYIPELFPTVVRASATGVSMNAGRFLTAITVFFVGLLVEALGGYGTSISVFALAYVVGLVALLWARETKGTELPQ